MIPFTPGQDFSAFTGSAQPLNTSASGLQVNPPAYGQEGPAIPSGAPSAPAGPSNNR